MSVDLIGEKNQVILEYSLIINLNAINQIWALVNTNTPFSNSRNPDLIKTLKLVKISFENASVFALGFVKNENETDTASTACFQSSVWSLYIRSGRVY